MTRKVYISYNEHEITIHDDFDSRDWSGSYHREIDWSLGKVFLSKLEASPRYEEFEIEGEKLPKHLYVVYVRYSTGDTFGRTDGCGCIVGVYRTRAKAEKVYKSIEDGTYAIDKKGKKTYIPWEGYFERFEGVHMEILPV